MYNKVRDITDLEYYRVSQEDPFTLKLSTSNKKFLYHYTSIIGSEGISKRNCFWVTQYDFLDDTTELRYMSLVLEGVIQYLYESKDEYDIGMEGQFFIYETIIKVLEGQRELYKMSAPISKGSLFILSLTENSNNKYLSKIYCDSEGTIIEIRNNIDIIIQENSFIIGNYSAKVEYVLSKQMEILIKDINEFFSEILYNLANSKKTDIMEIVETIKAVMYYKILLYSMFFKNSSYSKEEEYRIVFLVENKFFKDNVKFRNKLGKKIPYIEVKLNKKSITRKFSSTEGLMHN